MRLSIPDSFVLITVKKAVLANSQQITSSPVYWQKGKTDAMYEIGVNDFIGYKKN